MSDIDEKERPRDRDRPRRDRGRLDSSRDNRDRSNDRGREPRSMKSSQNRVFVSNIPYEYRWQDIKDLFRNQVGDVQFVELFTDDNDKPKGSGIVEFSDAASVKKCMELMQRYEVKGRKLVIKEDTGTIRDRHGAIVGGKRGRDNDRYRDDHRDNIGNLSMRNDEGKWGNTYGLSPHFLESLNVDAPLCNKVFVANLPYDVEKKKLKDVFRLAGRVVKVDMPLDKDGRSRGFSVVEFDHPVEAVQAISMFHNQVYMDRTMTVRMDRASETFKLPEGLKSIGMGLGPNGEPLKNVALNLPSSGNSNQASSILGAVPNNSLQLANALSGLGNVSALGTLANSQALQAANLSGLLGNGLGGADLSSLVQNPLTSQSAATQQQLAALAAQNTSNMSSSNGLGFNRGGGGGGGDSSFQSPSNYNSGNMGSSSGRFQGNSQAFGGGSGNFGNDRGFSGSSSNSMMRPSMEGKSFSRKVLVSNLPQSASYKMLHEKFTEFGDIQAFEEKNHGSILITYGSDWQAERAIKNLDKARIDGRMIDARLFF